MHRSPRTQQHGLPRGVALNLLASALTILAAIALLATAALAVPTPPAAPAAWESDAAARAFYEAVNDALRTGDAAALERIAAPDFVLHPVPGGDVDRAGLAHRLAAIHEAMPGLRLVVEEVTTAGDQALVRLGRDQNAQGTWLGVPIGDDLAVWGSADVLRVADGRVAEVWGGASGPLLETFGRVSLAPLPSSQSSLTFEVLTSTAGAAWTWEPAPRSRTIFVDDGEVTVAIDAASPASAVVGTGSGERVLNPGTSAVVGAGDAIRLRADTRFVLAHAPGRAELRAYEVAFPGAAYVGPLQPNAEARTGGESGVRRPVSRRLVDSPEIGAPPDSLVASFGRAALPPETALSLAGADGPLLLHVEAGRLAIEIAGPAGGGLPDCAGQEFAAQRLGRGGAILVPADAAAVLRAESGEPLVVFAVTILPDQAVPEAAS